MTPKVTLLTATLTYNLLLLLQDERPPGEGVVSPTPPHTQGLPDSWLLLPPPTAWDVHVARPASYRKSILITPPLLSTV